MRTNIDIDDELLADAQAISGSSTKKQTVERRWSSWSGWAVSRRSSGCVAGSAGTAISRRCAKTPRDRRRDQCLDRLLQRRRHPDLEPPETFLGVRPILLGGLILTELLQGFRRDADHRAAREAMAAFPVASMVGPVRAVRAADSYRLLRSRGVTVRKTIDVLIGTFCVEEAHQLLFSDRNFQPLVDHLGLQAA